MSILVLVEHDNHTINPATFSTITAAKQITQHLTDKAIGAEITALVIGENISTITEQVAQIDGIHQVIGVDNPLFAHQSAETVAPIIFHLANDYTHILGNATTYGKNILPRVAALLDVMQLSDISSVIDSDTFERPIYAGNVIATVQSSDKKKVITVRPTKFPPTTTTGGNAEIKILNSDTDSLSQLSQLSTLSQVIGTTLTNTDKVSLSTAKIVIAGGRGLGSAENYQTLLVPLAQKLNAALGASRAAVDLGFCPNDYQIGQTGKVIAPDIYIAIGISGAIQHQTGIKDAKKIIAINSDPNAPIFQIADYGLVADLNDAVPKLIDLL